VKIHAEGLFCLSLALLSMLACPTEVEEEWPHVGKPPAATSLGLMFLERGTSSYVKQGGGFTSTQLQKGFIWPSLCI